MSARREKPAQRSRLLVLGVAAAVLIVSLVAPTIFGTTEFARIMTIISAAAVVFAAVSLVVTERAKESTRSSTRLSPAAKDERLDQVDVARVPTDLAITIVCVSLFIGVGIPALLHSPLALLFFVPLALGVAVGGWRFVRRRAWE